MNDLTNIISASSLLFKAGIIIGLILIIIALSMAVSFFKTPTPLTLSRNQSKMISAIGIILIIIGIIGTFGLYQIVLTPQIKAVYIYPESPIIALENGTPLKIVVEIEEQNNIFLKSISSPLFFTFALNGTELNSSKYVRGPTTENTATFLLYPYDAGIYILSIDVTYGLPTDNNLGTNIFTKDIFIALSPNKPPKIEEFYLIKLADAKIIITVKAKDPENDIIYYEFLRIPPYSDKPLEIPPALNRKNTRIWRSEDKDIGTNIIIVSVRDGDDRGPWMDHAPVQEHKILNISDSREPFFGVYP